MPAVPSPHEQSRRLVAAIRSAIGQQVSGHIFVARGGKRIVEFDIANSGSSAPPPESIFDIASVAKTFTAALALRLNDKGRFDLDRPLRAYLPELPRTFEDITARNALEHDTGLPKSLGGNDFVKRSRARFLAEVSAIDRSERAGSGFAYSNIGPSLVAAALERSSGQPFSLLLKREILEPLRLRNTFFYGDAHLRARAPVNHVDGRPQGSVADWPTTWTQFGNSGLASSGADLWHFAVGLMDGPFLSRHSRRQLLARGIPVGKEARFLTADTNDITYGMGLFHALDRHGQMIHFHTGSSDFGTHSLMLFRPADGLFLAGLFTSPAADLPTFRAELFSTVMNCIEAVPAGHARRGARQASLADRDNGQFRSRPSLRGGVELDLLRGAPA
jgi:CubicO group peptidase (beta-lactamase class C family)